MKKAVAVGMDGSPESLAAADRAAREAAPRTLPLSIVHARLCRPLDIRLPDGDGAGVCRELRSRMPELACRRP